MASTRRITSDNDVHGHEAPTSQTPRPHRIGDALTTDGREAFRRIQAEARNVASVDTEDGVKFDVESIAVQEIRDHAEYPGLRLRVKVAIGSWEGTVVWDVSTGDPIVPSPRRVRLTRILGDPIELLGYRSETTVAEKGVTILERGIASTRWRDYVDIVQLCRQGFEADALLHASRTVARYRRVTLEPIAGHMVGYGNVGQAKWAAWRKKEHLESLSEASLDDQVAIVAEFLDPVFGRGME